MTSAASGSVVDLILAEEARLRRLALRLVHRTADADDLVQDTLLRAFCARDRFSPGTSIRAWTSAILRNVFLTGVVRSRCHAFATDTDAGAPLERARAPAPPADPEPSLAGLADRLDDRVNATLRRLPEQLRTPFLLAVVEDLTCAEIAGRLGVPVGTVMSRIHRARERMKRDLVHDGAAARASRRAVFTGRGERMRPRPERRIRTVGR